MPKITASNDNQLADEPTDTQQIEETLIAAAQRGDLNAFNALVLRYQDSVYNLTYRILGDPDTAADAAQSTFITVFRRFETYRGRNFRAWLLRVAINTCYDLLRYQNRHAAILLHDLVVENFDDDPLIPDSIATPEQAMQDRELSVAIQNCINDLSPDQRVVLMMRDIEGYSYQEIADTENTHVGTVKSRLSRARAGVCKCLQGYRELLPAEYHRSNE